MLIAVDNLQGYVHQLHLEGDARLVPVADYPFVAIDVHYVVRSQLFHVNEREGCKADKDEDVANEGKIIVLKLMRHDGFQFVFSQELPFLAVRTDMELGKWIAWNLAVIVCPQNDTLQPHATLPDSGIGQSTVCAETTGADSA